MMSSSHSNSYINVKQINLHHSKRATDLIVNAFNLMHTKNQRLIVLIQEPYISNNVVNGFDLQICNVFSSPNGLKQRTCIIATKDIDITLLPQLSDGDNTTVLVNTGSNGHNEELVLSSVYMPYDANESRPGALVISIYEHCSENGLPLILGCDTNSHHTLWGSSDTNARGEELVEFLAKTDLDILNRGNEPTFVTRNRSEVLDVSFASSEFLDRIQNWQVSREETLSDHKEINFSISLSRKDAVLFRNPRNTNWVAFTRHLESFLANMEWNRDIDTTDKLDSLVETLSHGLHSAFISACPGRICKPKVNKWWCKELEKLKRETRLLYRRYKASSPESKDDRWTAYKLKRNEYMSKIDSCKRDSWIKYCNEIEGVNAMSRVHRLMSKDSLNSPGVLRYPNGDYTKSPMEAAKLLLDTHFPGNVSLCRSERPIRFGIAELDDGETIDNIVSHDRIHWAVSSFEPYKSPGFDEVYPVMLQKAWCILHEYITVAFKASLKMGYIPKLWQSVRVTFIPKTGKKDYTQPKSFRPISLTSFLLKCLERLIDRHVKDHLTANCPLNTNQYAFQAGKSTESALHVLTSKLEHSLAQKEYAVCTFLDIEGAFDSVSFYAVENALATRHVNRTVSRWIIRLLCSRIVTYETSGTKTSIIPTKGTPQGGVISPTLWIVVMDELLCRLSREGFSIIGYADDLVIVCRGKFLSTLCGTTQRALNIVERWCIEIGLKVNPDKTELMVVTNKRILSDFKSPKLFGKLIEMKDCVKYLGVTFTPKLNWSEHIKYRVNKCIRVFWCCKRAIGRNWGLRPANLLWLHNAVVKPMLAYAAFIWWEATIPANAKVILNHLQRVVCLSITGAAKTTPQLALETIMNIPPLDIYIQAEARISAFRLRECIVPGYSWRRNHSSALDALYELEPSLKGPVDRCPASFVFARPFKILLQGTDDADERTDLPIDKWFTDASVSNQSSGYGIFNENSGREICGYLGKHTDITQAELAAIQICVSEIEATSTDNTPIVIYSDSLGSLKALGSYKIESLMVMDCIRALVNLCQNRDITLKWVQGHSNNEGNLKADKLAKAGAADPAMGQEPFLGWKERKCRAICDSWVKKCMDERWRYANSCRHTKEFVESPNEKITNKLLTLDKIDMSYTVSIITGNIRLNKYLNTIGVRDDPDCDYCGRDVESAKHFLCECTGFNQLRKDIFDNFQLSPKDTLDLPVRSIATFVKRSGRFALSTPNPSSQNNRQGNGLRAINAPHPTNSIVEN